MVSDTLEDNLCEKYRRILEKYEPYSPDAPEYNRFDGNQDPMRALATEAKEYLEKHNKTERG